MQGRVKFFSHSGLSHLPLVESEDVDELRSEAARYLLAERKADADIYILNRGHEWEVIGRSDANGLFVGDDSGLLILVPPIPNEDCWECGYDVRSCGCNNA